MTTTTVILGVLGILTTWGLFYLNAIKESQTSLISEIKTMNNDIRDVLVQMGKSDERFIALTKRLDDTHEFIKDIDQRVYKLETI